MDKVKDTLVLKAELENLREQLNDHIVKYMEQVDKNNEEYIDLLSMSKELDGFIVEYIKNSK